MDIGVGRVRVSGQKEAFRVAGKIVSGFSQFSVIKMMVKAHNDCPDFFLGIGEGQLKVIILVIIVLEMMSNY